MSETIAVSELLDNLKTVKIEIAETRTLPDETKVIILVGTMPAFPHGSRPAWYPLVLRKGQSEVTRPEAEAILRHFWHFELEFFTDGTVKHSKLILKHK
jgi:hypothetical protein